MGFLGDLFKKEYINLSNEDLASLMAERNDIQYVDVRTKPEYKHRRIKGFSKNIDFYKFTKNPSMLDRISKDKPVVLICETGSRSRSTAAILANMGYKDIYNVRYGVSGWTGSYTKG